VRGIPTDARLTGMHSLMFTDKFIAYLDVLGFKKLVEAAEG
jgi:hypothetical protein